MGKVVAAGAVLVVVIVLGMRLTQPKSVAPATPTPVAAETTPTKLAPVAAVRATTVPPAPTATDPPTAASTGPRQVTEQITEADLNQKVNARMDGQQIADTPLGPAALSSLTVHLQPNLIVMSGSAEAGGATLPFDATGTMAAQGGHAVLNLTEARIAGLPLPDGVRQSLQRSLQSQVDSEMASRGLSVSSVRIETGRALVTGSQS